MKLKKSISSFLILGILLNNIYFYSNANDLNRYETLEGESITIDDSLEGHLEEIEIFGNTVQDPSNLEDIQSVGDLYVDDEGNPILDKLGRKQYVTKIVSNNFNKPTPITDGLITWIDARDGSQGDTILKDRVGNNDFILKDFIYDDTDGFIDGRLKVNGYGSTQDNKNVIHALNEFVRPCKSFIITVEKNKDTHPWYIFDGRERGGNGSSGNYAFNGVVGDSYDTTKTRINGKLKSDTENIKIGEKVSIYFELKQPESFIMSIMCRYLLNESMDGYFYSLTVYDRALTKDEILHNCKLEGTLNTLSNPTNIISDITTILLPVQLQKVGDVADRLYWDNSQSRYLIEKNIKELTLNGTETNWKKSDDWVNLEGQNTISFQRPMTGIVYNAQRDIRIISNKFKAFEIAFSSNIIEDKEWIRPYSSSSANVGIRILKSKLSGENVEDFKQWLKNNPVTVYYQLSSPEIISTEIKNKLNIATYDNQTYIYVDLKNNINPYLKVVIDRLPKIAEDSVVIAEENGLIKDISLARMYINMLPESLYKDQLQERLNSIFALDITLDKKTISSNVDLYIKFENTLSMSLNTNSVTFENYSGVEDMELLNALNIAVQSSLPYDLNVYMPNEIHNSDKTNFIDINTLNIKESTKTKYQQFTNTTDKIVLIDNCESSSNKYHAIDLKLSGGNTYKVDTYKTVLKFEVEQR